MAPEIQVFVDDETGDVTVAVKGELGKSCVELSKHVESFFGANDGAREFTDEYTKLPKVKADQWTELTSG